MIVTLMVNILEPEEVTGTRSDVNSGVWHGNNKICAVGVSASRWITIHGAAINVNSDLKHFNRIIPCGIDIPDRGVSSLQEILGAPVDMKRFEYIWLHSFAKTFNLDLVSPRGGEDLLTDEEVFINNYDNNVAISNKYVEDILLQFPDIAVGKLARVFDP